MIERISKIQRGRIGNSELVKFLERTFEYFNLELNLIKSSFNRYNELKYIFAHNERTWLGILNNAIIRAYPENAASLQEYGVYNLKTHIGRADFLVKWKDSNNRDIYLLFEAKQYEETSFKKILDNSEEYLKSFKPQLQKYYESDFAFFEGKTIYLVPIAFGWIKENGFLNEAKRYYENDANNGAEDFCDLNFEESFGSWVYGKIISLDDFYKS